MSRLVKTAAEICKANTNTSTAKYQYSFSKASRFPNLNLAEEIRNKKLRDKLDKGEQLPVPIRTSKYEFYSLPSTLSTRKTTFGKGNKYDFTKVGNNCKISSYSYKTDFDKSHPHGPMYSFTKADRSGKGQIKKPKKEGEEENKEENKKKELVDLNGPSPARYNYLKPFGSDAPKVSMKGRHNTPIEYKKDKNADNSKKEEPRLLEVTIQIRNTGKYIVSQIPNVNSVKYFKDYDPPKKKKEEDRYNPPGPADYKIPPLICHKISESQFRNYERIGIKGRYNIKDSRSNYPGPGSYPLPSDFGQYESKDADKYPKDNVYVEEKPKFEEKAWRHNMRKIPPKPKEEPIEETPEYEPTPDDNAEETPENDNDNNDNEGETHGNEDYNKKEETPGKKEEEEKKIEKEEEKEKEEEDKQSEIMMLKDMLVYKEGEAKEIEGNTINKTNEETKKGDEVKKEEPKKEEETKKGDEPKKEEETKKEEEPKKEEETKKGDENKEEDKESQPIMLRDILTYKE